MPAIVRALRHRNYRLYFGGQLVSLVGTWMQQIAMSWLAYRLTDSVLVLGLVGFAGQIPVLVFAPFGGMWSDRVNRRRILIATQSAAMVQAIVLAALTLSQAVQPWHLVALALVLGTINAIDIPARQAFVVHLVDDRADLSNAIALNSFAMNAARLLGPTVAGVVLSVVGEGICFLLNAVSYLTVLLALVAIRSGPQAVSSRPMASALRQGFRYAFGHDAIRSLLLLVAVVSFTATPYTVLMPVYAKQIFGGDARTLGLLLGCAGGGALAGTVYLAARKSLDGLERVIALAPVLAGAGLLAFAFSRSLWVAAPALLAVGFGVISTVGLRQYPDPVAGAGRTARPRHVPVHHGLSRHGAARQPDRRQRGPRRRRAGDAVRGRPVQYRRRTGLRVAALERCAVRNLWQPCVLTRSGS
ncbi:MAG: arabinose efflux permease family protein [Proteobacteria bacterium]|nr:arabinose efflux permease family protein [Pseudomonadota bacterium]